MTIYDEAAHRRLEQPGVDLYRSAGCASFSQPPGPVDMMEAKPGVAGGRRRWPEVLVDKQHLPR